MVVDAVVAVVACMWLCGLIMFEHVFNYVC